MEKVNPGYLKPCAHGITSSGRPRCRWRGKRSRWSPWQIMSSAWLVLVIAGPRAHAGIADTPLPQFSDGKPSVVVLGVPGVVKRNRLQTDFLCTALDSVPVDIGVEIFGTDGALLNAVSAGVGALLNVAPAQTVTFGTSGTLAFLETTVIPLASVSQGSGRVVASSDKVRCNVLIVDDAVTPPVTLATLGETVQPVAGPVLPSLALPQFSDGVPATHAAVVPGVTKRQNVETNVFCTSLAAQNIHLGVEVLAANGIRQNDISTGNGAVLNVAPGATVTFGTTGTAAFLETTVITLPSIAQGLARVVSSSPNVTCAAFVVDAALTPPTSMGGLIGGQSTTP